MTGRVAPTVLMAPGALPLVLASGSRFRRRMLEAVGLSFSVAPSSLDEVDARARLARSNPAVTPAQVALFLAEAKAIEVSQRKPGTLVIGGDQVLDFDGTVFGKSANAAAAREQLTALRGRTHALQTAVVLAQDGKVAWSHLAVARLTMRDFSAAFLDDYLESAGDIVTETVGGYALERHGAQLFSHIDGDYFTIIGLPLLPLLDELRRRGVLIA